MRMSLSSGSDSLARWRMMRSRTAGRFCRPKHLCDADADAGEHGPPALLRGKLRGRDAGFLSEFPLDAGTEIDAAVHHVVRLQRAGGKIGAAGIGCVAAHDAEQVSAIGALNDRHAETVFHLMVG